MDPITTAIVASLTTMSVGENVIIDRYEALKNALKRKFGENSEVVKSIVNLETRPDSGSRKATLIEEVALVKADQDAELVKLAQDLLDKINTRSGKQQAAQNIFGSAYNTASGTGQATAVITASKQKINTITITEAKANLEQIIEQVIADVEPTIISTDTGQQIALVPLEEFNAWQETLYLLSNPFNAEHLRQSIMEAKTGKTVEPELLEV